MTVTTRSRLLAAAALAVLAVLVAACGSAAPSVVPSRAPTSSPSAQPTSSATASAAVTASTTPSPSAVASPSIAPSASASAAACAVGTQEGQLPSDRLVDMQVSSTAGADRVTFIFGNPSLPGPAGPPQGALQAAEPPFTYGASGEPIDLRGEHAIQVRFSGMSIANDVGQEVYTGPREVRPNLPALRHAILYDASEGIVGWYLGYDGGGCVTLAQSGNQVTVTIDHP